MANDRLRVGCIGAGILGSAIMRRLLDRDFDLRIWNRSTTKLGTLVESGARPAASPADLAANSDFVLTCVSDGTALEAVVFADGGIVDTGTSQKLLVDMSTVDANHTKDMAARLEARCGMGWLDAPISGGAPAALEGRMAVMVGGSEADFERARPLWDALAGRCTLMGPIGAGQATKMVNQVLVSCGFAVLAEACALAQRAGVDAGRIPGALTGGRADSRLLQEFMPKMAVEDFALTGRIDSMLKDLELIHDLAKAVGAPMPVTSVVTELNRKLVADGLGARDNSEMVRLFKPAS